MNNEHQSSQAETLYQQGCNYCERHDYHNALDAFNQAIRLNPKYAQAWNNRGNALSELKRQPEAFASYEQAVALHPSYHQAWHNRGILLKEMGAYGNAIESFDRAIALSPDPLYFHHRDEIYLKSKIFA